MSELLQFMYQGEVNVKQAELQAFMSIAESLQIKGLATNSTNSSSGGGNSSAMKGSDPMNSSYSQFHSNNGGNVNGGVQRNHNQHQFNSGGNHTENHRQTTSTPLSTTSSIDGNHHATMKGEWGEERGARGELKMIISSSSSQGVRWLTIQQRNRQ
jgi:hypothetical protein